MRLQALFPCQGTAVHEELPMTVHDTDEEVASIVNASWVRDSTMRLTSAPLWCLTGPTSSAMGTRSHIFAS